jgi:hypothetical protein
MFLVLEGVAVYTTFWFRRVLRCTQLFGSGGCCGVHSCFWDNSTKLDVCPVALQAVLEAAGLHQPALLKALRPVVNDWLKDAPVLATLGDESNGEALQETHGRNLPAVAAFLEGLIAMAELRVPADLALVPSSLKAGLPTR